MTHFLLEVTQCSFAERLFSSDVTHFLFDVTHFWFATRLFSFAERLFSSDVTHFLFDVTHFWFATRLFSFAVPLFLVDGRLFSFDVTHFWFAMRLFSFGAPHFSFATRLFWFDRPQYLLNMWQSRCGGWPLPIRHGPASPNVAPPTPCYLLSMLAHETLPRSVSPGTFDQRVILHGITWDQYEAVLAMRGDSSGVRIAYFQGELELMSPSRDHESIKTCIARLVEAYAEERGLRLDGFGSMTLRDRPKERGVEPDECYEIDGPKAFPDFAIEVIWTGGGLDKLEIYRAFGVREVWIWREGNIEVYGLGNDGYRRIGKSEILPELDLAAVGELATRSDQTGAVREFRRGLK